MGHQWIVGVLDDLRTYAELNGLDPLAASLAATAIVAEDANARAGGSAGINPAIARARLDCEGPGPRHGVDREVALAR